MNKVIGGDVVTPREMIEVLLFNVCPRKDVNDLAKALIDEFGTIAGVLSATKEELMAVDGVGENVADYLLIVGRCMVRSKAHTFFGLLKSTAQFKYMLETLSGPGDGGVYIYLLDADGRVKRIENACGRKREELRKCISSGKPEGTFVARFRNGEAAPSEDDNRMFEFVAAVCHAAGTKVYDYCVVNQGSVFSYYAADIISGDR